LIRTSYCNHDFRFRYGEGATANGPISRAFDQFRIAVQGFRPPTAPHASGLLAGPWRQVLAGKIIFVWRCNRASWELGRICHSRKILYLKSSLFRLLRLTPASLLSSANFTLLTSHYYCRGSLSGDVVVLRTQSWTLD
jgi:hypothetical protein